MVGHQGITVPAPQDSPRRTRAVRSRLVAVRGFDVKVDKLLFLVAGRSSMGWARVVRRERRAALWPVSRPAATGSVCAFKLSADVGYDARSASRRACGFDTMVVTRTAARGAVGASEFLSAVGRDL